MKSWLSVSAHDPGRDSGVDVERYSRCVHDLVAYINDAVERSFAGSTWLKQRFPAKSYVRIDVRVNSGETVNVDKLRTKTYGGPKEIICPVSVPAVWFDVPGDGLLAIRLFRAVLLALDSIGECYEIGSPPLRATKADPGKPDLMDPFSPRLAQPSPYGEAACSLQEIADRAEPHQLVLAGHGLASRFVRARQEAVGQALGMVEAEHVLPAPGEGGVRVWVIRQET